MNWPDNNIMQLSKKKIPRKSEVALRVALNLSYSHLKEGNQVYLVFLTSNNEYRHQLSSASEAAGIFHTLSQYNFDISRLVNNSWRTGHVSSDPTLFYMISDGLEETPSYYSKKKTKKIFIHTLHSLEKDITWLNEKKSYFDTQRSKKEFLGKTLHNQKFYLEHLENWLDEKADKVQSEGGKYIQINDNTPISYYLKKLNNFHKNIMS